MSGCDLDLWHVDPESLRYTNRHTIKVCTEFEQNRAIPSWIIDKFANLSSPAVILTFDLWPLTFDLDELLQHFGTGPEWNVKEWEGDGNNEGIIGQVINRLSEWVWLTHLAIDAG